MYFFFAYEGSAGTDMHHLSIWYPQRLEEGLSSPTRGIADSCGVSFLCWVETQVLGKSSKYSYPLSHLWGHQKIFSNGFTILGHEEITNPKQTYTPHPVRIANIKITYGRARCGGKTLTTPLQKQVNLCQPGLHSEAQDSSNYTVRPYAKKTTKKRKQMATNAVEEKEEWNLQLLLKGMGGTENILNHFGGVKTQSLNHHIIYHTKHWVIYTPLKHPLEKTHIQGYCYAVHKR